MLRVISFILFIEWSKAHSQQNADDLQKRRRMQFNINEDIDLNCFTSNIWTRSKEKHLYQPQKVNPNGHWVISTASRNGRPIYTRHDYTLVYEVYPITTHPGWYAYSKIGHPFLHCGAGHIQSCYAGKWHYTTRYSADDVHAVVWAKRPDPMGTVVLNFWRLSVNDSQENKCDNLYLYGDGLCIYGGVKWTLYNDQCIGNQPMYFYNDNQGNGYNLYYEQDFNEWVVRKNYNETIAFCKEVSLMDCNDDSWVVVNYNTTIVGIVDEDGCVGMMDDDKRVLSAGSIIGICLGIMILFVLLICMYYRFKTNIAKNELQRLVEDSAVV